MKRLVLLALVLGVTACKTSNVATVALPQLSDGVSAPCCPSPRFLLPRTKNGFGRNAAFDQPAGIAYDDDLNAYFITDRKSNTIRRYDVGGKTSTVAGGCERELLRNTCVGRELDGIGSTARFDRPTAIVYDRREHGLIVYDSGGSALRLVSPDGRVHTVGSAENITALAIDARTGLLYAAQDASVVEISIDPANAYVQRIWSVPRAAPRNWPSVNAVAVDQKSGDIYAAISTGIYKLRRGDPIWSATLFAGKLADATRVNIGAPDIIDGSRASATFEFLDFLALDEQNGALYAVDFLTVRKVTRDGFVKSVAGSCEREPGWAKKRGEFACDYPPRDGTGARAHFGNPIGGLAVGPRGELAVVDGATLLVVNSAMQVKTVAGNRRAQPQPGPAIWDGRYVDTATGEALDVYVRGDDELEVGSDRYGRPFDVRRGSRSMATEALQFWTASSYVRVGPAARGASFEDAVRSLHCGALKNYGAPNPEEKKRPSSASSKLFLWWYPAFGRGQKARYSESAQCATVQVTDEAGRIIYEDDESRTVAHFVTPGPDIDDDQRVRYSGGPGNDNGGAELTSGAR